MRSDGDEVVADILLLILALLMFIATVWAATAAWEDYRDRLEPRELPTTTVLVG